MSGDTAIVGARNDRIGQNLTQGGAYVYSGLAALVPAGLPVPILDARAPATMQILTSGKICA